MGEPERTIIQHAVWIRNGADEPVLLCIEPWASETHLAGGKECFVVFEGPSGKWPGIEWSKDRITAYGWSGATASVYLEGELILDCPTKVPPMPEPQ
jgi:hypothetical protein